MSIRRPPLNHICNPRLASCSTRPELRRLPLLGRAMRRGRLRAGRFAETGSSRAFALTAPRSGQGAERRFFSFPGRNPSRTGELLPFKKGGFIMPSRARRPIVPGGQRRDGQPWPKAASSSGPSCCASASARRWRRRDRPEDRDGIHRRGAGTDSRGCWSIGSRHGQWAVRPERNLPARLAFLPFLAPESREVSRWTC